MTITIRRDDEISDVDGEWFRARWHYSFDSYHDPDYVQFGTLRVFNDDRLIPGAIWPMHPHRDIEGLTYVVEGSFRHQDDVGGAPGPLPAGSVQRMTLGRGAWHSEQNASETDPMRFIQMWILPSSQGLEPGVEQKVFTPEDRTDTLLKVISGDGGDAVLVHQDAHVFVSRMNAGAAVRHALAEGRGAYLYVIEGDVTVNGERMETGAAAQVRDEEALALEARAVSELILVDVALATGGS
ncbi:MAG TPA: pirin family protein [Actinomycetota bacterium]|nr:pirin family protein [Actinomycetota bacterium]